MIEDIDKFARGLPRMTMHGPIPPATTHQLAARVVELLARVAELNKECEDLTGEVSALSGKVEDLENVIEAFDHGIPLKQAEDCVIELEAKNSQLLDQQAAMLADAFAKGREAREDDRHSEHE